MPEHGNAGREVLPVPARRHQGLTTYDAKDPATSFPSIEPLRPPAGAPNVLVVLLEALRKTVNEARPRARTLTPKPRVCGALGAVGDGAVTVIVGG
jgi:hypothetical protein